MIRIRPIAALLGVVALAACEERGPQDILGTTPGASVKFFNFAVNGPGVNFYANDTKLTAISSTSGAESATGTAYGSAGSGGFYSGIAPGQYTFTGRIAAATDKDLPITSLPVTVADGKSYSVYLTGFYDATTKKADAFVVEDDFPATPDYTRTYVRFVNAIPNSQPMALYVRVPETGVEAAASAPVAYKGASAFVSFTGGGVVDLLTRTAGSTTAAITRTAVSFLPGHAYTIAARGDMTVTSTTATNRPILDNTANR